MARCSPQQVAECRRMAARMAGVAATRRSTAPASPEGFVSVMVDPLRHAIAAWRPRPGCKDQTLCFHGQAGIREIEDCMGEADLLRVFGPRASEHRSAGTAHPAHSSHARNLVPTSAWRPREALAGSHSPWRRRLLSRRLLLHSLLSSSLGSTLDSGSLRYRPALAGCVRSRRRGGHMRAGPSHELLCRHLLLARGGFHQHAGDRVRARFA